MALEVEVLEAVRRFDQWTETRIIPADYLAIFDIAKIQERVGSRNGFEVVIDELIKRLVKAQYRRTVVIWGWFDREPMAQRLAWWIGLTCAPERRGMGLSLVRLYPKFTFALIASGDECLSIEAKPLLKWSPDTGLTRFWSELGVPDFPRIAQSPTSHSTHLYAPVPLDSLNDTEIRMLGGQEVPVRNRRCQIRWIDVGPPIEDG